MAVVHFITHPEVVIDPAVPVADWPLSPVGIGRVQQALGRSWLAGVTALFCSAEQKARDAAELVAARLRIAPVVIHGLGENDRSATGSLPRTEFEAVADEFFARPNDSVRGWERAVDAQRRIVAAVDGVIALARAGDIAVISHGGVGALLLCHLKNIPISRSEDQPGTGGGNMFSFRAGDRTLLWGWQPIDGPSADLSMRLARPSGSRE